MRFLYYALLLVLLIVQPASVAGQDTVYVVDTVIVTTADTVVASGNLTTSDARLYDAATQAIDSKLGFINVLLYIAGLIFAVFTGLFAWMFVSARKIQKDADTEICEIRKQRIEVDRELHHILEQRAKADTIVRDLRLTSEAAEEPVRKARTQAGLEGVKDRERILDLINGDDAEKSIRSFEKLKRDINCSGWVKTRYSAETIQECGNELP